jgi:hypothetical protein
MPACAAWRHKKLCRLAVTKVWILEPSASPRDSRTVWEASGVSFGVKLRADSPKGAEKGVG